MEFFVWISPEIHQLGLYMICLKQTHPRMFQPRQMRAFIQFHVLNPGLFHLKNYSLLGDSSSVV